MNKTVSASSFSTMMLRIRDASTDVDFGTYLSTSITFGQVNIARWDLGKIAASTGGKSTSLANRLVIGNYYKIQIAYVDNTTGLTGYYSTIAITKYTLKPNVYIDGLSTSVAKQSMGEFVGVYSSSDASEKCYQYRFLLTNASDTIIDDTGWRYHNSNKDTESGRSEDIYQLLYDLSTSEICYLRFQVITNNGLQISSPKYPLTSSATINASLTAKLSAELDYDNGCIRVWLEPDAVRALQAELNGNENQTSYAGKFVLSRSSSTDHYKLWLPVYTFELTGQLPTTDIFIDFTCLHGETYQYCIQQYNSSGIYSSRILSDVITAYFEDAYLYDGERQLRIRFNPKVSSFKTVLQENKKTTLGAQYPFFFRSGNVKYKEFPISGLISYMMDENEFFVSRQKDLGMSSVWQDSFDITDPNQTYERRFKLEVLDWLNAGDIKLFRSPAEGNYLVRLMNTSLSPNDAVSRMINTFSCTAVEVDECTTETLNDYGFLSVDLTIPLVIQFKTIDLLHIIENLGEETDTHDAYDPPNAVKRLLGLSPYSSLGPLDLLDGYMCTHLRLENCRPGLRFKLGDNEYQIGVTGQYECTFETPQSKLFLINSNTTNGALGIQNASATAEDILTAYGLQGQITVGILTKSVSWFDNIAEIHMHDQFAYHAYLGYNWVARHQGRAPNGYLGNQAFNYYNSKDQITKIQLMEFNLNSQAYQIESLETLAQKYDIYMTPTDNSRLDTFTIYEANTYGEVETSNLIPRGAADLFVPGALFITEHSYGAVKTDAIDSQGYPIWENDNGQEVWSYNPSSVQTELGYFTKISTDKITNIATEAEIDLGATQIYIDGEIFDIGQTGTLRFEAMDTVPTHIQWGRQVTATLFYSVATTTYAIESESNITPSLTTQRETYYKCAAANQAQILKLVPHRTATDKINFDMYFRISGNKATEITAQEYRTAVGEKIVNNNNYGQCEHSIYVWNYTGFVKLERSEYESLNAKEYPLYWVHAIENSTALLSSHVSNSIKSHYTLNSNSYYKESTSYSGLGGSIQGRSSYMKTARKAFFDHLNEELAARQVTPQNIEVVSTD